MKGGIFNKTYSRGILRWNLRHFPMPCYRCSAGRGVFHKKENLRGKFGNSFGKRVNGIRESKSEFLSKYFAQAGLKKNDEDRGEASPIHLFLFHKSGCVSLSLWGPPPLLLSCLVCSLRFRASEEEPLFSHISPKKNGKRKKKKVICKNRFLSFHHQSFGIYEFLASSPKRGGEWMHVGWLGRHQLCDDDRKLVVGWGGGEKRRFKNHYGNFPPLFQKWALEVFFFWRGRRQVSVIGESVEERRVGSLDFWVDPVYHQDAKRKNSSLFYSKSVRYIFYLFFSVWFHVHRKSWIWELCHCTTSRRCHEFMIGRERGKGKRDKRGVKIPIRRGQPRNATNRISFIHQRCFVTKCFISASAHFFLKGAF